jgi:ribonuclease E
VEKGERDMKGAALTTYLSLPGRYMVAMPGSDSSGISRKVENEADRKKLKEMAAELKIPEGIGYIIRTEALGKKKTELNKDLQSLIKLHRQIRATADKSKAPALIYQESDLVIRTIRDYFTAEIDEVIVDNPEVYKQAREFFKRTMPKYENIVKLHLEKRPIFSRYQLEEQIDQIYEKKVPLKSGGSLVIEPTEALVSIDVNSGKSTGERGVEETAFKTNMEAVEEAARQLRLRDLGGLIVLDLIDMRDKKHMGEVEKALKLALKADKARVSVGKISQFGMLEMSRQRIKQTLDQGSVLICPHCEGRGKVKSVENMAISFLRKVHATAAKGTVAEVRGNLPLEVAYYLLNRKKRELVRIETDYEIAVTVKGKPSFLMNQLELEIVRRDKPPSFEGQPEEINETAVAAAESMPPSDENHEAAALPAEGTEIKKKKRRRKKKVKVEGESQPGGEAAVLTAEHPVGDAIPEEAREEAGAVAAVGEDNGVANELKPAEHKKKRRRRRRRSKGVAGEGEGTVEAATLSAPSLEAQPAPEPQPEYETGKENEVGLPETALADPVKKPRRKQAPRKKKVLADEVVEPVEKTSD